MINNIPITDMSHEKSAFAQIDLLKKEMEMEAAKKTQILVSEVMTFHPHTLQMSDSLEEARRILEKLNIRHLPVMDDGKLVGILSLTDILRMSFGSKFGPSQYEADEVIFDMLTIEQVMKHDPITVESTDTVRHVGEILSNNEFHALPVVEKDKLVGIITTTDIIKFLLDC